MVSFLQTLETVGRQDPRLPADRTKRIRSHALGRRAALWLLVGLGAGWGCTSAPTLPVPPPAVEALSAPDPDGFVQAAGTARSEAFVACVNMDTDAGVIVRADLEGAWQLEIEGMSGDTLLFFQLQDGGGGTPVERLVPFPREPDDGGP